MNYLDSRVSWAEIKDGDNVGGEMAALPSSVMTISVGLSHGEKGKSVSQSHFVNGKEGLD